MASGLWLLLLTGSRGPILFYILFTALYILIAFKQKRIVAILSVLVIIIITQLLVSFLPEKIGSRFFLTELSSDFSYYGRLAWWQEAIENFKSQPILGVGTGGYKYSNFMIAGEARQYPHNIVLEIAAETGIIGLSFFSLFLIKILKIIANMRHRIFRWDFSTNGLFGPVRTSLEILKPNNGLYKGRLNKERLLLLNLFFQFFSAFGCALVSGDLVTNSGIWFFCGLILAVSNWQRSSKYGLYA